MDIKDQKVIKKIVTDVFNEGVDALIMPQFDRIDKKLDEHDKRFDEMDKRFDEHDKKFANMATKDDLEKVHESLENSIEIVDRKLDAEIVWRDEASVRIKRLELKTGLRKGFTLIELVLGIVIVTVIAVVLILILKR